MFTLGVKAFIITPISMSPKNVRFKWRKGETLTKEVEIKAGYDEALILSLSNFSLNGKVNYKVEEVEKGKRYKIIFNNIPECEDNYAGFLSFKTNYLDNPIITIRIKGIFDNRPKDKQ